MDIQEECSLEMLLPFGSREETSRQHGQPWRGKKTEDKDTWGRGMQKWNYLSRGCDAIPSLLDIVLQHQTLDSIEVKTGQWAVKPLCVAVMSTISTAHSRPAFRSNFWPDSSTSSHPPSPGWAKLHFQFCGVGDDDKERRWERSGRLWEADGNQYELWRTGLVGQEETWRFQWTVDKDIPVFLLVSQPPHPPGLSDPRLSFLPCLYDDMGYSYK